MVASEHLFGAGIAGVVMITVDVACAGRELVYAVIRCSGEKVVRLYEILRVRTECTDDPLLAW